MWIHRIWENERTSDHRPYSGTSDESGQHPRPTRTHIWPIWITKLKIHTGQTRQAGNWGMVSRVKHLGRGELTLSGLGVFLPPERIFRTGSSGGSAQMLHLFWQVSSDSDLDALPVVNTTMPDEADQGFHVRLDFTWPWLLPRSPPKKKIVPNSG